MDEQEVSAPAPLEYAKPPRSGLKLHPFFTAVLLAMPLLLLVPLAVGPFLYVISGRFLEIFTAPFDTRHAGTVLDQPTIGKWLIWSTIFIVLTLPYLCLVGWLSRREARGGYWTCSVMSTIACICLGSVLAIPSCWLIQYVCSMGYTPQRVKGLVYCALLYALLVAFISWSFRRPRGRRAYIAIGFILLPALLAFLITLSR